MIHTGDPMPRRFSNENREEMRRMYFHDRLGLTEIGQTFTCSPDTVAKIVDLWRKP
jgi:transposase-like protein